jgi:hypothetical protein
MTTSRSLFALAILACAAAWLAPTARAMGDPPTSETPDQRFEKLLATALKDPGKADWKTLRRAFARTTRYQPYNIEVTRKLREIFQGMERGEFKKSEADLLGLVERERYMRIDTLAMLMMLYEQTEQPEKAEKFRKLVDGMTGVLDYPKAGVSLEKPIEVLFVEEEYLVTTNMHVIGQALTIHNGHRYDLLMIGESGSEPAKTIYFDIELLKNGGAKLLDKAGKPAPL